METAHTLFSVHRLAASGTFRQILKHFPQKNTSFVFAYGSGVFQQQGHKDVSKNMLDFIFVVDNPQEWHRKNLARNPKHYSFLKYLGAHNVANIQERFGAKVYFNTLVPCESRLIKYGVISTESLINDLLDWDTLYVSGRLHKPVLTLHRGGNNQLGPALISNLQSALHMALLQLPDSFSEEELFTTITGLSYAGDFRMTVGEDKNKVRNIVKPNMAHFRELYSPVLQQLSEHLQWNEGRALFKQSLSAETRCFHLNLLPKYIVYGLVNQCNADGRHRDAEDVLRGLASDSDCEDELRNALEGIVKQSSWSQSIKGIFTAGLFKSIRYSANKLKKMLKSKKSK
jgi:translocator assembly and maintenance protein 41